MWGGALIIPYWTVSNDNITLISIRSESDTASAVKVRVLDEEGGLLKSFNLYLDARTVWTAATLEWQNEVVLWFFQVGCVLPTSIFTTLERPSVQMANGIVLGAARGSMEIIEMASGDEESELIDAGRWSDCESISDQFVEGPWAVSPNEGLSAPRQAISASSTLISVLDGVMNIVPATALRGFSDAPLHSAPESASPDLSHGVDSSVPGSGMRSSVCAVDGCRIDEWNRPIEAVAAVLTASTIRADYSALGDIGGQMEWIVHRPLKRYESEIEGFELGSALAMTVRARSGVVALTPCAGWPERPPGALPLCSPVVPIPGNAVHQSVVLTYRAGLPGFGESRDSPLLGHPEAFWTAYHDGPDLEGFEEGTVELLLGDHVTPLTAPDGGRFIGEPVISFAVQQFVNGTIEVEGFIVLSNYRATERPRRFLNVEPAD